MIALGEMQELVKDPYFWTQTEAVFFEAMNAGYAAEEKPKKTTIAELAGSKFVEPYVRQPWIVKDVYLATPLSDFSGGMTVIEYEGVPIWMMQYFGHYYEEAISCLKAALRQTYSERHFVGGRGPAHFVHESYIYENPEILSQDFKLFRGDEFIHNKSGKVFGRHVYQGGAMC